MIHDVYYFFLIQGIYSCESITWYVKKMTFNAFMFVEFFNLL